MDATGPRRLNSPTARLVMGALVSLAIIGAYAGYTLYAVARTRQVQVEIVDRNRKASLQLIRIQADLNALALAMRDMLDRLDNYPLAAWSGQLNRIRENLADAINVESSLSAGRRNPQQTGYLKSSFDQFWSGTDRMLEDARAGREDAARQMIRATLQPRQEALSALTARLLVENNEEEERAAEQIGAIYRTIERNAYLFLAASLLLIATIGTMIIRGNRAMFDRLATLSNERRELAQQLIATQESTFRAISRDLHDEFGQILTALGAMLQRADRQAPSPEFRQQIQETNEIVQETLEKIRGLSQSLQPVILEEQGLEAAIPWHLSVFERQTGVTVHYERGSPIGNVDASAAVHVFRVLQEALNNVARHSKAQEVFVRTGANNGRLVLEIEDHGVGLPASRGNGIGLAAMRERAEILNGALTLGRANDGGTRVRLEVPIG